MFFSKKEKEKKDEASWDFNMDAHTRWLINKSPHMQNTHITWPTKEMTEHQALHPDANDLENNFLKNNSRKKTYAEVIQATIMEDSSCDEAEDDLEDHSDIGRNTN